MQEVYIKTLEIMGKHNKRHSSNKTGQAEGRGNSSKNSKEGRGKSSKNSKADHNVEDLESRRRHR